MTLGEFGSTLNDELNRLANGGTYRDKVDMVDEALAAKQWANRENINPYSTDTVGILNEIAGLGLDKRNWLDFNGVCNYIAGTTGLPAAAALRQVYNTTDLLTGVASYYVDATAPTNWGSLGYVRLNGVTGNYLSVPDAAALDITGDIDIRVQAALDDWTPAALGYLIAKVQTGSTGISYGMYVNTNGTITFVWSSNGTTASTNTSSVAPTVSDGATLWIRATRVSSTGLTKFYTSTDGTNWTQLGTDVSGSSGSIFASTTSVTVGSRGDSGGPLAGNFYRAQVLDGIDGTTVLDVNIATDYKASNEDTFTATTGQTVTVNGVDTIANLGTAGSLLPTTLGSSTAADSNDPKFLDFTGTNYVYLPGVQPNRLSVPNAANLQITGDIDVRVRVAADDWTPASNAAIAAKWSSTTPQRAWALRLTTTGAFAFDVSADGTASATATSSVTNTFADGSVQWVRATWRQSDGRVQFFTSNDGITWTQFGTDQTASVASIYANTADVEFGTTSVGTGNFFIGKIFRAQIYNGIDGTKVLDVDTSVITAGSATSFTAVTGQTVTIARSTSGRKTVAVTQPTWLFGTDDYMEVNNRYMASGTYLYLPGVASNYASAPDSAALDITGDIDLRAKVAMDDWTPSASSILVCKYASATQISYALVLFTDGRLILQSSANGTTLVSRFSTVATGLTDGTTKWVRATLDVDNGASGNDVQFFLSDDGSTWTQLGTTVTTAGTTSIFSGTSILEIGSRETGTGAFSRGKFFRAQVLNGIGGTVAFDADFETSITSLLQTTFTESSLNAATVTINRSGSAYRSAGITAAGYLYPGATNTFSASATDFLNFGAADSFTLVVAMRSFTTSGTETVLAKRLSNSTADVGYWLYRYQNSEYGAEISDGTIERAPTKSGTFTGTMDTFAIVRNVSSDNFLAYVNASSGTSVSDTTTGSLSYFEPMRIGRLSGSGTSYLNGEIYAAAVFRSALTASQIRQISNYFANREVYL